MRPGTLLVILAAALIGCGGNGGKIDGDDCVPAERSSLVVWVRGRGKVMAESNVTIAPPRRWGLKITRIVAEEGETVKKGDVLLELDDESLEENVRDYRRDIRSAQGALDSAQATFKSERDRLNAECKRLAEDHQKARAVYKELRSLPLQTDLANARIDRDTTAKAADQAKVRYENMKQLYEKGGGVSLQQLEQRELEYRSAVAEAGKAELTWQLVAAGPTEAELRDAELAMKLAGIELERARVVRDLTVRQLEQAVKKAEAYLELNRNNLARIERVIEECTVRAPVDGTVFYKRIHHENNEKIKVGMEVRPWYHLMDLPDTSQMQIKVGVPESDIGKVKPGQAAKIIIDAYRQREFTGRVTKIEPVTQRWGGDMAEDAEGSKREDLGAKEIEVLVTFSEQDDTIRTGLNGQADIRTEVETEGLTVPREALFRRDGRDVVYVVTNGRAVRTPVRVGERGAEKVIILEGLAEGDLVSLVSPEADENGEDRS
jgi:RND family efflux transporter MFP subunit